MLCSSARATVGVSCALTVTTAAAPIAVHLCLVKLMAAQITRRLFDGVARKVVIAMLDQQPGLLLALADSGQRIAAMQLLAVQANGQVAADKAGGHLIIGPVGVRALVPDNHAVSAILVVGVLQRPVFGATRHPSVLRVDRGAARDRPRHQDSVDLQPKVVVVAARRVLLDHEMWPAIVPS